MLVYGDRSETVDPRAYAEALKARWEVPGAATFELGRHAALVALLIDAGKLAQALADAAFDAAACDTGQLDLPLCAAVSIAPYVATSWWDDLPVRTVAPSETLVGVLEDALPAEVVLREPEGYAFYALYPEMYLQAALDAVDGYDRPAVIGLRSIGSSLAPLVTCSGNTEPPITVRPLGHPFARKLKLSDDLESRARGWANQGVLVVDEGPGASGSSFGAVGDWLEDAGVPPERITYMPSHAGDLGPQASERHRARWRTAKKAYASFEDVILPRLPGWVEPLIGPLTEPLQDLSGGLWRGVLGVDAPAWPEQERRKYLAVTEQGRFLLKFAGLGGVGERKLERAKALAPLGFTLAPVGLSHGFLIEPLLSAGFPAHARTQTSRALRASTGSPAGAGEKQVWTPAYPGELGGDGAVAQVSRYLAFRARELAPPHGVASDDLLRTMMRRNFDLAGLPQVADIADRIPAGERGPSCAIDGRLHAWEWRRADDGRLIKLDALDHCEAHDLVGAQDVAWDLAGAAVELGLLPEAAERLRTITAAEAGQAIDPRRVAFQTLGYLAFQIGWWTFAAQASEGARAQAEVDRYKGLAARWSSPA